MVPHRIIAHRPKNSMHFHISNLICSSRQSKGSSRISPLIGRSGGLGSTGSCSQSKGVNLKWFKHEGIKTEFSHLFSQIQSNTGEKWECTLQRKEHGWWKHSDGGLFWFLGQIKRQLNLKALIEFSQIKAALWWLIKLTSVAVCALVNSSL